MARQRRKAPPPEFATVITSECDPKTGEDIRDLGQLKIRATYEDALAYGKELARMFSAGEEAEHYTKSYTAKRDAKIIELAKAGKTDGQIVHQLKKTYPRLTRDNVKRIRRAANIKKPRPKKSQ